MSAAVLDPAVGYLIVAPMAVLFANAARHKTRDYARFRDTLAAHRIGSDGWARRWAWLVPCAEATIASGLLWQPVRLAAQAAGIGVLLAYAATLHINLGRGRVDLDCGCGAPGERREIAAWMVWRNLGLAAALGISALPWQPRPLGATDLITIIGGVAVAATLYAAIDHLLGVVAPRAVPRSAW